MIPLRKIGRFIITCEDEAILLKIIVNTEEK